MRNRYRVCALLLVILAAAAPAGAYFLRIISGDEAASARLTVVR